MTLGLRDLYYALCTETEADSGVTEKYGAPKKMADIMTACLLYTSDAADE